MPGRPAVFLDRDGVINERRLLLVRSPRHFAFRADALGALRDLAASDYLVVVATNQPAVGWGFATAATIEGIHARMVDDVRAAGGRIDRVEACFAPRDDPCRKPRPGMLLRAAADLGIDLGRSWMVGDTHRDVLAGRAAGCRTILVNPTLRARWRRVGALADAVESNLSEAVQRILRSHPPTTPDNT